jgi:hypothetical protein
MLSMKSGTVTQLGLFNDTDKFEDGELAIWDGNVYEFIDYGVSIDSNNLLDVNSPQVVRVMYKSNATTTDGDTQYAIITDNHCLFGFDIIVGEKQLTKYSGDKQVGDKV